ncbi:Hypothetical protein NTJ_12413 [Nesidiocoris tenuis]|uniref:Uncharacterized protein n=1 Tax=Nesidiocoris tenuis TaxID=355587 RepID=A0ABN7B5A9_9HEMI|nr:Hypothetical protein NTJ_12413 [Nesidiocoris tenuis]
MNWIEKKRTAGKGFNDGEYLGQWGGAQSKSGSFHVTGFIRNRPDVQANPEKTPTAGGCPLSKSRLWLDLVFMGVHDAGLTANGAALNRRLALDSFQIRTSN